MVWTTQLDLADKLFFISIHEPFCQTFTSGKGTPLNEVGNLSHYFSMAELCVADGGGHPMVAFKPTYLVSSNISVVLGKCMDVTVGTPINHSERMIIGEGLYQLAQFFNFSFNDYIVVEKETEQVLDEALVIEMDIVLKLCHNLTVSGVYNETSIVEHGTPFGEISYLMNYFNPSFVVYCTNDTDLVLKSNMLVLSDTFAAITKVSHQEIVIKFDENEDITVEEVENTIKDLVELPNDEHLWIEVISEGDNVFTVSVKQTGSEEIDIADLLEKCLQSQ